MSKVLKQGASESAGQTIKPKVFALCVDRRHTRRMFSGLGRSRFTAGLVAVLTLSTELAQADPDDRLRARQLAAQGFDALQRKDYVNAEVLLRRADQLIHAPTLVVDHARALVGLGKLVEAHEGYELVLREGVQPSAPWPWKHALDTAKTELAALEPRLAWLTLRIAEPPAPRVQIDGREVPNAALGVPRATNPGPHQIHVEARGFLPKDENVELGEGKTSTLEVRLERDPNFLGESAPAPTKVVIIEAPEPPKAADRTLDFVLLGVGAAGIAAGAVTGIMALGIRSDLKTACPGGACVPLTDAAFQDDRQKLNRYRGLGIASGVAFGAGLSAALSGAALFVFTGRSSQQPSAGAIRASVGPGGIDLQGSF